MKSEQIKTGIERIPNRSLLYALGYTDEEVDTMRKENAIR